MFIKSLGHKQGRPYTEYEVHLEKQQRIPSWLKYLLPVTLKGGSTKPPWLRVCNNKYRIGVFVCRLIVVAQWHSACYYQIITV